MRGAKIEKRLLKDSAILRRIPECPIPGIVQGSNSRRARKGSSLGPPEGRLDPFRAYRHLALIAIQGWSRLYFDGFSRNRSGPERGVQSRLPMPNPPSASLAAKSIISPAATPVACQFPFSQPRRPRRLSVVVFRQGFVGSAAIVSETNTNCPNPPRTADTVVYRGSGHPGDKKRLLVRSHRRGRRPTGPRSIRSWYARASIRSGPGNALGQTYQSRNQTWIILADNPRAEMAVDRTGSVWIGPVPPPP